MIRYFIAVLFIGLVVLPAVAQGQRTSKYICSGQGYIYGSRASVTGQMLYFHSGSPLGDGDSLKFSGNIKADYYGIAQLIFDGFANLAPYAGVLRTSRGDIWVSVLSDTGGKMIIYAGVESLGPPQTIGEFIIRWEEAH